MLVYVDRPSEISGVILLGNKSVHHNIQLASSGFHWIQVEQGKEKDIIKLASSNTKVRFKFGE